MRRVQWSPHHESQLASCSYDMSVCLWETAAPPHDALVRRYDQHTEFAVSVPRESVPAPCLDFFPYNLAKCMIEFSLRCEKFDRLIPVFLSP